MLDINKIIFEALPAQIRMLLYFMKNSTGKAFRIPYEAQAAFLGVTKASVKNYLNNLQDAGILKYKFNGTIIINPDFWYVGEASELENCRTEYAAFIPNAWNAQGPECAPGQESMFSTA